MMKYQKSMMKIMESILGSKESLSIEEIIKKSKTGRNSSFEALRFLEESGFILINSKGNQKMVSLVKDNFSLQFKYYFDSIKFKTLEPFVKMISMIFVSELFCNTKIKSALIFGSSIKSDKFNDIDILLLGKNLSLSDLKKLDLVKNKLERVFEVIINLHGEEFNFENLMRGVVIYQSSYIEEYSFIQREYFEFVNKSFDFILDKDKNSFDSALINLAYCQSYINNFEPKTKKEALDFFDKKINSFKELKKVGLEIGKEIFK